jgi:hypothetical protein
MLKFRKIVGTISLLLPENVPGEFPAIIMFSQPMKSTYATRQIT